MPGAAEIVSAGAVVARKKKSGRQVLLVHRPKYDDWSFPKGKLDPGEHVVSAAVREVAEETGLDIRLGPPLSTQRYTTNHGDPKIKDVHYWVGRLVNGDDISSYKPNNEIDKVEWVPVEEAPDRLTYDYDRDTLTEWEQWRKQTYPLVILRHSRARSRKSWRGDDRERTLTKAGELQSELAVPLLGAYGVERLVSSSSRRCWTTLSPYADVSGHELEVTDELSEEDATPQTVEKEVQRLLGLKEAAVLCTHRPELPWVFKSLGLEPRPLEPGALFVAHHRQGKVVVTEHHDVAFR